ncbi:MAG: glutamate synthase subunit beta, partial [Actinomycetota bacterium]
VVPSMANHGDNIVAMYMARNARTPPGAASRRGGPVLPALFAPLATARCHTMGALPARLRPGTLVLRRGRGVNCCAGHDVVVLERADRIGGLLRYGIPEFKMEKQHLDRRIEQMRAEGTEFRTSAQVGVDVDAEVLLASHDAVVLACGATAWRDLPIEGRDLRGIHQAREYLPQANRVQEGDDVDGQISAAGKHVVIIGGGDTGADCLGTAHRQGAASVTQLEIMPRPPDVRGEANPWPQWSLVYRTSSAHEEGGERLFSVNTERFVDDGEGNVAGLVINEVRLVNGSFEVVANTQQTLRADLVFLALGFVGPEKGSWLDQLGVALDARGNVARTDGYATNVPGLFVAGDMGRGQSLIVWAIAEGRSCASAVDSYVMGQSSLPSPIVASARPLA